MSSLLFEFLHKIIDRSENEFNANGIDLYLCYVFIDYQIKCNGKKIKEIKNVVAGSNHYILHLSLKLMHFLF